MDGNTGQPSDVELKLVDCTRCGGSGFDTPGTGYNNVCSQCGGLREVPAPLLEPKKFRTLTDGDLQYVIGRLPKDIRQLLREYQGTLFLGGGFIRATIAGEEPSDIDLFGVSKDILEQAAQVLHDRRPADTREHKTDNAITMLTMGRMPVQFITRWTFDNAEALVSSFDFTVCQSAVWRDGKDWKSAAAEDYYVDLAARRLVYTCPVREEEAGGSMLRVLKYLKRGYSIQSSSLSKVIARLVRSVHESNLTGNEEGIAKVVCGLLREVDPLHVVDGFDFQSDHRMDEVS